MSTKKERNSFVSPSVQRQKGVDKPEISSISTTFTVAPSVSSSSSSAPSSVVPVSPVSMECDLKSPSSVHDSTISRLIDAMSLGNEQDTCGSISALIGQFENTNDQSHESTPSCFSKFRPVTPKALEELRSSLKNNTSSPKKKRLLSPQNVTQMVNHINRGICSSSTISQANTPAPVLMSSPETAELEEVYTILDEEVLLPVSVYNLRKQTVHVQADTKESTPSSSLGSSPTKVVQFPGKGHNMGWDDVAQKNGGSQETDDIEERVYEEVNDLPLTALETEPNTSKRPMRSSVNHSFQFLHDSPGNAFTEVELNVDEDPLEMMLTSPRHGSQWEGLISPTKRQAIYQNHESTPSFSQQKQPLSHRDPQQHYSHSPHVTVSQCNSPMNAPSYRQPNNHQNPDDFQSPVHRRLINSRLSNHSPLRQNSYPIPLVNNRESSSYRQDRSYSGNHILNRSLHDKHKQEQVGRFHNGFSSSEILLGQSAVSTSNCRDRALYSPSSDCEAVYSHPDYDCFMPSSDSLASQNSQEHSQTQTQSHAPKQTWNQKVSHVNVRHHAQADSKVSLHSNSRPLSMHPQSTLIDSTTPSPCKSKSLGDLTSEDISCNFQSKYHIISRSFITPHMRKQKITGPTAGETFTSHSCDPLTEQLRKLVSLEGDVSDRDRPRSPPLQQASNYPQSRPQVTSPVVPREVDDSPPLLTRRLSSRSQSRVRHINSRARERQQEALKPRAGVVIDSTASIGGVVLRNKPASQNPPANRHSTGSYIAGYFGQLEDRGLPEGACTSLRYGNGDQYRDRYYTDDSLPPANNAASEPEVYFLLRL